MMSRSRPATDALSGARGGAHNTRLLTLDGLRSVVLFVLLVHFIDSVEFSAVGHSVFVGLQMFAAIGVDVFLALSAFLITGILLDTKAGPSYFRNFYVRRLLRIFPLYYGFLLVFFLILPAVSSRFERLEPVQHVYYWGYLVNVAKSFDWELSRSTGHFWSLGVEEQFYLIWPAVVFLCDRRGLRRVCVACLLLSPVFRLVLAEMLPGTVAFHQLVRFDVLALGGLLALEMRSSRGVASTRRWLMPAAVVAVATSVVAGALAPATVARAVFSSGSAYWAGALLLATLQANPAGRWARFVASWPLRRVGMYSYAIYVLHDPIADIFTRYGLIPMPERGVDALVYCAVMIPICVAAGALSWHLYERPFLRLKDRFSYQHPRRGTKPAGAVEGSA